MRRKKVRLIQRVARLEVTAEGLDDVAFKPAGWHKKGGWAIGSPFRRGIRRAKRDRTLTTHRLRTRLFELHASEAP